MANLFLDIPVPASNGSGAPVDVSAMGATKSFVCGGGFQATVNVEFSTDAGALTWAPLATFQRSGNLTVDVAARWIRAVTSEYRGGAPNLGVGSSDAGTLFALLLADGSSVDVSTLPLFKTVVSPSAALVEVSADGVSWAQIFSLPNAGDESMSVYAQFARVTGGVDVTLAGANDGSAGGGEGCPCPPTTEHVSGEGEFDPDIALDPTVDTSFVANTGEGESTQIFTLADGLLDGQIRNLVNESTGFLRVVRVTPENLGGGMFISTSDDNGSATLIWNDNVGEWRILGTMLGWTLT